MWARLLSPPVPPGSVAFLRALIVGHICTTRFQETAECWAIDEVEYSKRASYHERSHHVVIPFDRETVDWINRERNKFDDGPYRQVPAFDDWRTYKLNRYPEHFLHVAIESAKDGPLMVAYTPNDDYGRKNRQVRVKPGRYLAKFYPDFPNEARVEWTAKIEAIREREIMKITTDPREICTIYRQTTIGSCMDGTHNFDNLPDWPTAVYGAPGDLALAYLGPVGNASARSVVWPDKKVHTSIYGEDANRLQNLLRAAGYSRGYFKGAKIRKIKTSEGFLMPFVDGAEYARVSGCGEFLVLGDDGGYSAKQTCGYAYAEESETYTCDQEDCDNEVDEDGDTCRSCRDDSWVCQSCDRRFFNDYGAPNGERDNYCLECWENEIVRCADCGDTFHPDDAFTYSERCSRNNDGVRDYCGACDDRADCGECGDSFKTDDLDDNGRCEDCPVEVETCEIAECLNEVTDGAVLCSEHGAALVESNESEVAINASSIPE
jgi:hypothetical protein